MCSQMIKHQLDLEKRLENVPLIQDEEETRQKINLPADQTNTAFKRKIRV